ncbi:hypothetical protein COT51_03510 [candidate division WWE3 bacterium CG08_land_8_20_14_0_20_41_15]|uniref:ComEC/Rec2-related protein domain-containing protein n=1 Tax=candidate division WWE3 bacterium CG08_land_8_20_14_0_20_41_15 TaxID=1975086 RepID=A0A2H0X8R3_UNCKA|nr:MAG: hypothetical protein COT51_03510 [candidate division WWE3 bacterium CG08_land_8_20_14_0_20_41_15]
MRTKLISLLPYVALCFFAFSIWYLLFVKENNKLPDPPATISLSGTLLEEPYTKGQSQYFKFKRVTVAARIYPKYHYGDSLLIEGKLKEKAFLSYPKISILENQSLSPIANFTKKLTNTRLRLEQKISGNFPEPQASLLSGIVLGSKRGLPQNFNDALRRTGTLHIVVVSGFNISLIAGLIVSLTKPMGRKLSFVLSIVGVLAYVLMVGAEAPVRRAGIMGLIAILGSFVGRPRAVLLSLIVSSYIMLLLDPLIIFDIGFQLTFLATFSIILLSPIILSFFKTTSGLTEAFATSLSAQLLVWPVIAANFKQVSFLSPLVNLFISPIIGGVTYGGILFLVLNSFSSLLSRLLSYILWVPLTYFVFMVERFSAFKFMSFNISGISTLLIIIYYYFVGVFIYTFRRRIDKVRAKMAV